MLSEKIKNKLKKLLKNKEIVDIIVFGSILKGKAVPRDIDLAIITEKDVNLSMEGFHISTIKPSELFINTPTLAHTILREGYSIKNDKPLAEVLRFKNKVLFTYSLQDCNPSKKVRIVTVLRGKNKTKGMVEENNGTWLARQVFTVPSQSEYIFEQFFINFAIKYTKNYVLIH